ncbi:MAG: signal peptidase II [Lachnospiraceae bacterium]|nr:signal peptidase II [Lachnospiraceae bacterium]
MMSKTKRILFFLLDLILVGVLVYIDRITKLLAVDHLKDKDPYEVIAHFFELRYLENRGAAFGMLQNQRELFIAVSVIFLVVIVILLILFPCTSKYRPLRICLVLIAAGAIGNLYDRITLNYVIDFLYFIYIDFPIFNVADIYVTVAAFALVILFIFIYKDEDLNIKNINKVKKHSSMVDIPRQVKDDFDNPDEL